MGIISLNDPEMMEIFDGFLVETKELLESLSQDLMTLENNCDDLDLLNRIFRSVHTIKGTASFMGFDSISAITHQAEDLLNKLRKSELVVTLPIIDVLLEVHDWIKLLLERLQAGNMEPVDYSLTLKQIELLKNNQNEFDVMASTENEQSNKVEGEAEDSDLPNEKVEEPLESKDFAFDQDPPDSIEEILPLDSIEEYNKCKGSINEVLNNKDLIKKPGDFTENELVLIDCAFKELNFQMLKERKAIELLENEQLLAQAEMEAFGDFSEDKDSCQTYDSLDLSEIGFTEYPPKNELLPNIDSNLDVAAIPVIEAISSPIPAISDLRQEQLLKTATAQDNSTKTSASKVATDSIRVDVSRVETLMDLSGELVLGRNRLSQITDVLVKSADNKEKVRELIETTAQVDFITSEIQAAVMKMRMVPVAKLYQKAPRIVRDLSKEFGKVINLVVKGEETEIDRGIIEELNDPLVHMIRNSCDHGIESQQDRIAAGKTPVGTITLDAEQEGNAIVLRITDDGRGMDPDKILAKAIEKGIIPEEQKNQFSRREIFQFIFLPGFSTAAVVSKVSGRGVGMDVVRTNIQNLKGMIDIESEIGKGTSFIIKLPLTLAIIQGLLVKIQNETYAIPLSSVVEVVSVDIQNVYSIQQQEVIRIREDVLPLLRLDKILKTKDVKEELINSYVVVVGIGVQRVGFVVDELLGQQEIVIKSLGEYLGHIKGIAGSTILGDGCVIMIIDVVELVNNSYKGEFVKF